MTEERIAAETENIRLGDTRLHFQEAHDLRVVHDIPDTVRSENQELV